jgi:hypothetical protein
MTEHITSTETMLAALAARAENQRNEALAHLEWLTSRYLVTKDTSDCFRNGIEARYADTLGAISILRGYDL